MATKLDRKIQRVFAQNSISTPQNVLGVFGSLTAGSPKWSGDIEALQGIGQGTGGADLQAFINGWGSAAYGSEKAPCIDDMNSLFYIAFYQLAYLFQNGIAEWDPRETYYQNGVTKDGNGIYVCVSTSSAGISGANTKPSSDTTATNWKLISGTNSTGKYDKGLNFLTTPIVLDNLIQDSQYYREVTLSSVGLPLVTKSVVLELYQNGGSYHSDWASAFWCVMNTQKPTNFNDGVAEGEDGLFLYKGTWDIDSGSRGWNGANGNQGICPIYRNSSNLPAFNYKWKSFGDRYDSYKRMRILGYYI